MRQHPEMGSAASILQVTVSRKLVSEIPVSNTALVSFMKQPSAGVVTEGQRIGYLRVSTVAQTLDQQNDALAKSGATKTFSDTMSGARDDRPGLTALMEYIREGDTVVVWKLDRFGRNTRAFWKPLRHLPTGASLSCRSPMASTPVLVQEE